MRKLLMAGMAGSLPFMLPLDPPAEASLFVANSPFTVDALNSPGTNTSGNNAIIQDGLSQAVATSAGVLGLVVNEHSDGGTGEWITFSYSGTPLIGAVASNWHINEVGLQTNTATTFTQGFISFDDNGANLVPTSCTIFGATAASDPSGGGTGIGCLGAVIADKNPAGPLPSLGTFISPFTFLSNTGIDPNLVTSYFEALHFVPTNPVTPPGVPEPGTLALLSVGLLGLGVVGLRRKV